MTKYHITKKGEPGVCRATKSCPLGVESDHYSSREEAQKAYETSQSTQNTPSMKKAPPTSQGLVHFQELRYLDYSAQERHYEKLRKASPHPNRQSDEALDYYKAYTEEQRANSAVEYDRLMKIFSHTASGKTSEELIASGEVTSASSLPEAVKTSGYSHLATLVTASDKATKEAFYKLPTSYHKAFVSTHSYKGHAVSAFKNLVKLASDLHEKDAKWEPDERWVEPRRMARYGYGDRPSRRVGEAKDMQNTAPSTYAILEEGAKLRVGEANVDRFWRTVQSDSVNKPKLTDYFRALKNFT